MRWRIPQTLDIEPHKSYKDPINRKVKKGFPVKYCPKCKLAWDKFNGSLSHLTNFPKIGLISETCPACETEGIRK